MNNRRLFLNVVVKPQNTVPAISAICFNIYCYTNHAINIRKTLEPHIT